MVEHGKNMNDYWFIILIFGADECKFVSYCSKDLFYWKTNCDYKDSDIVTRYGMNSLMRCGKACLNHKDCTSFVFSTSSQTCSLKKINNPIQSSVATPNSICGVFPKRIAVEIPFASTRQWITSQDGTYQFSTSCKWSNNPYSNVLENIETGLDFNVTACGQLCKANLNCIYFDLRANKVCYLKRLDRSFIDSYISSIDPGCGFFPSRATVYGSCNTEIISNYCGYDL